MSTDIERNKRTVVEFYQMAFNAHQPAEAVRRYVGPYYRQHNFEVDDGSDAFIEFVTGFATRFPQLHIDIHRVIAEGDFVVLHCLAKTTPEDRGMVAIDIFRLEQGRIVEHWDALQPVPEHCANPNGMF